MSITVDPARPFSPRGVWKEIPRIGFTPDRLELWTEGVFEDHRFVVDGAPWLVQGTVPGERRKSKAHFRVVDGAKDPPTVVLLDPW